ncbi:hypothetical protein [Labrys sp. 22185]|uniref:hypothetical protein n=1 Tax=Labrys sp. 22185 TaxID=3453888 RepID=UPI003F8488D0
MFDNLVAQGEHRCPLATLFDNAICRRCGRHPEAASLAHKLARRRVTDWHLREVHFMNGQAVSPGLAVGADIRRGAEALPPDNQVPTVGQLFEEPGWLWIVCERCNRFKPVRTQSLIQQWGRDTSSNVILRAMRCSRCKWKRAKFQCPSWADKNTGWAKFPQHELSDDEL